ncbi:MAG: hemerythrin domain-containing protein [Arhodomonas sp.]|nr:hemerythrin domain-containing protein [Arhodomonas sp.]
MSDAISTIQREHNGIWRVLDTAEALAREYRERGQAPDRSLFGAIFEYIEEYADRVHHPKEDDYLFRLLRARAPQIEPVLQTLEHQHSEGPGLVAAAREALDAHVAEYPDGRERFEQALHRFVEFERDHLRREESEVIPLAREVFTHEDWAEINAAFADNRDPLFGDEQREHFRGLHQQIVNYAPTPIGLGLTREVPEGPEVERVAPQEAAAEELLAVEGLVTRYGPIEALHGVDVSVGKGRSSPWWGLTAQARPRCCARFPACNR